MRFRIDAALWAVVAVALAFAATLLLERARIEGGSERVTFVMDGPALREQAALLGEDPFILARAYQALGLPGIALYEETPETLARAGRVVALLGREARALAVSMNEALPDVPGDATLLSEIEPGALAAMLAKHDPPARQVTIAGRTWWWWPAESLRTRPAGPDAADVAAWHDAGFEIAYRPRNFPNLQGVGSDFPSEARYLIHAGLQVAGHPDALNDTVAAAEHRLTALIEGTPQDGFATVASQVPTVRLLSFTQEHQNLRLSPTDLVDKYLLAVGERGVRLLYVRPYTEEQQGDMRANTEALIAGLTAALKREGYEIGPLPLPSSEMAGPAWARIAAAIGILAALALLARRFRQPWGVLAALAVAALAVAAAGVSASAAALIAALVFPVLGFAILPWPIWTLLAATGISLVGAALLSAVGSERATMLALQPFVGVGATLVVPPALFLAWVLLRERGPIAWLRRLWGHQVRLGEVAIALAALLALALVFVRRGNVPSIGVSEIELALRSLLSDLFVRPRFKELLGHPLAFVALAQAGWPRWVRGGLLVAGVVAQASILNSVSHYHTPMLVSLQRSLIALALGLIAGALLLALVRWGEGALRRAFARDDSA